ncbi:MAG: DNA repair protein RecO [Candidatus Omnitrophica bacterium]|nr:DNA repair protein RecO [Candidatus Omnitrophota bacterium]
MAIQRTRALVLRRQDFGDTSLIIVAFSREFGKLHGLIKGIKADYRRYGSRLEPLGLNDLVFYEKRQTSLQLISQCDLVESFPVLRERLAALTTALYWAELVDAVTSLHDPNHELFQLLVDALGSLGPIEDVQRLSRLFEVKVLATSGFFPRLEDCVGCRAVLPTTVVPTRREARLSARQGGLLCGRCGAKEPLAPLITRGTIATIRQMGRESWPALLRLQFTAITREELATVLQEFLGFHIDKRFRSLEVSMEPVGPVRR